MFPINFIKIFNFSLKKFGLEQVPYCCAASVFHQNNQFDGDKKSIKLRITAVLQTKINVKYFRQYRKKENNKKLEKT